jgi:Ribbon-helix-helix protein, copG family
MKSTRVSEWPKVHVNVSPATLARIERMADQRALSVAAVIREALDRAYGQRAV